MRRLGIGLLGLSGVLLLGGCDALRDAFSAQPTVVARAAGQTLSVEQLAEMASKVRGMPLEAPNLTRLANAYVDYILFAMAMADGRTLGDSTVIANAMWATTSQMRFDRFVERISAGRSALTPPQVDSVYAAGEVRAFQHILLQVPPSAAPPVVQQKQTQAQGLLRQLTAAHGANFVALAKRYSDDPRSKLSGGYLDLSMHGQFVPQFEDAAWQLAPGAMSGVVKTNFGFHIIRRPPLAEIRDTFTTTLKQMLTTHYDSAYFADIARNHHIKVRSGAAADVRQAMQDLDGAARSNARIASFDGGSFRMRDLVRWLYAIDPRIPQAIPQASDAQIGQLLDQLIQRHVALRAADSAHVQVTDSEWQAIRVEFDSTLKQVEAVLQLTPAMFHDSASTPEGRSRLAAVKVTDYLDRLVSRRAPFIPVPPLLTQSLRERSEWSVDATAVRRAAERATALRASADSLQQPTGPGGAGGGGVRPAPGPAPVMPTRPESLPRTRTGRRTP